MYEITLNGRTLYHPNSDDCNISQAIIHEALNDSGYMEITVPYSNPMYAECIERTGKILVYKDNVELWHGVIRDVDVDFSKNKKLYVVGEAGYLNDTVLPQMKYEATKFSILESFIQHHNSMVEPEKRFSVGIVGNNALKDMIVVTDWDYTLDAIRTYLCEEEEYFRIRHVDGQRFIDIMPLETYGKRSTQDILFGDNLLDYAEDSNGEEIATMCIPLGVKLEQSIIEDYDNYLTCSSANGGKNYVELPSAVNRLGRITKVVHFNVLDNPADLVTAGVNYLQSAQFARLTLSLSAVDLSILDSNIESYSLGDYVRAICEPFGMDAWLPIREKETDLINISENKIKIGSEGTKSMTMKQAENYTEIEKLIPKKDSILEQAKKNATAILNSAGDNGHVVFHTNSDGVIYEILVMDTEDINTASKVWRWNESGFGYANSRDANGELEFGLAMTMDGAIVADFITAGVLRGREINNGNGTFKVTESGALTSTSGNIGGFTIGTTDLRTGDAKLSKDQIGCGVAGYGIVNLVGNSSTYGYIQISNSGSPIQCLNGIRIYGDGRIVKYNGNGGEEWTRYLSNIPTKGMGEIFNDYLLGPSGKSFADASRGDLVLKA